MENTTTVNVRRGVSLTVTEAGKSSSLVAYVGDTVEKALEDNNILLKAEDEVTPSRETLLEEDTAIQIRRPARSPSPPTAKTQKLSLVGATVAQPWRRPASPWVRRTLSITSRPACIR